MKGGASQIDLREVMQEAPFEPGLIVAARALNVDAMVERFEAGACVVTLANVLHYTPNVLPSVMEAIDRLGPEKQEFNLEVLWAMGLRLRGDHLQLLRPWRSAWTARRVLMQLDADNNSAMDLKLHSCEPLTGNCGATPAAFDATRSGTTKKAD